MSTHVLTFANRNDLVCFAHAHQHRDSGVLDGLKNLDALRSILLSEEVGLSKAIADL